MTLTSDPDPCPANPAAEPRLAQALASRICHDLVSPVGAVVNGADLLAEIGGSGGDEEIALLGQSAERAAAVLAFHRLAFGAAGAADAPVARTAWERTAMRMVASERIAFRMTGAGGPELSRPAARLAALLVLAGRGLLSMRGTLSICFDADGDVPMRLSATGEGLERKRDMLALLGRPVGDAPEPREVEFLMIGPAAAALGGRIVVEETAERIEIAVLPV
ncbi:MAG: histidine phosphotransferase family protein [Paracoccaceae bacterium]